MSITMNTVDGITVLSSCLLEGTPGIAHGFSTRVGGVSAPPFDALNLSFNRGDEADRVAENFRRFCTAIGTDHTRQAANKQIHTDVVRRVTAEGLLPRSEPYAADGLVTDVPGICLTVFTADCVPVLLCDPHRRCVAAIHSGWRSTALCIAQRGVESMINHYGCRPEHIRAAIGPSIGPCCFETDRDVPDAMPRWAAPHITPLGNERFRVDLKAIIRRTLERSGVLPEHIDVSDHCTACRPDLYWSHRILGPARGSMAAMIQLTNDL